jgi:hypothetical protein
VSEQEPATRIAVAGKRDLPHAGAALAARIRGALQDLSAGRPALVLTSLARGADQIAAGAAREMGFEFRCVFPFRDYERDFAGDRRFGELRALASAIEVLDGDRSRSAEAHARAAARLLDQCDVLLAVIDEEDREAPVGGTRHTVERALERGLPVVSIGATPPHPIRTTPSAESSR